jgi:hypothetical protein
MRSTVRRRSAARSLVLTAVLLVAGADGHAQQEERTEAQEQEIVSLATIVAAALQGQIVPTDEPFEWANDYLKSSEQTTFIPFTLSVDQAKFGTPTVAMYIFVAEVGATATPATAGGASGQAPVLPEPAFEDAYHIDLGVPTPTGVYEIRRGFWAPAGTYDVYVALSESSVPEGTEAKTLMLKKAVEVPDLWGLNLTTSSVIMASRIEPLTAPPPVDQQLANPYTLGTLRIVPKSIRRYLTSEELSIVFLVYNVGLTPSGLPDVDIEYTFNTRGPAGVEYFNKTNPQLFNDQTLPPGFDLAAGHQLVAGQAIPLTAFPAADYRLEIIVTDKTNGASLTRNVDFSVSAS